MEKVIYGFLSQGSVELVERQSKFYVRYDAGAHQVVWREDEITQEEAQAIMQDESAISSVLINVQLRLKNKVSHTQYQIGAHCLHAYNKRLKGTANARCFQSH